MRDWLLNISPSVKLSYYCKLLNINPSNLTKYLQGYKGGVDETKLLMLKNLIINDLLEKLQKNA